MELEKEASNWETSQKFDTTTSINDDILKYQRSPYDKIWFGYGGEQEDNKASQSFDVKKIVGQQTKSSVEALTTIQEPR